MNNLLKVIETILISLIVIFQVRSFFLTRKRINTLKNAVPNGNKIKVVKLSIPLKDIENLEPEEIVDNIERYKLGKTILKDEPSNVPTSDMTKVVINLENDLPDPDFGTNILIGDDTRNN
jgi:hypothetical protein